MSEQLTLAVETPQLSWRPGLGRAACSRDPAAGPGSCYHWWEGCTKPDKRGCYLAWARSDAVLTHWRDRAPPDWTPAPDDLPTATAATLNKQGLIEIREPKDARWQWRRKPAAEAA